MAIESTKKLVEIANIIDNIVLLKNGSLRAVIEVSALNFELRSEEEQTAILQNFQRFVNSIDFPLQIVVNSRKLNIDGYLKLIDESSNALTNELLKIQAAEYSKFVKELSELSISSIGIMCLPSLSLVQFSWSLRLNLLFKSIKCPQE